jgi:hypothetical protein
MPNSPEQELIARLMGIIHGMPSVGKLEAKVDIGNSVLKREALLHGFLLALPSFTTSHNLRTLTVDNYYLKDDLVSRILARLPGNCRLTHLELSTWSIPNNDIELLPNSLRSLHLAIEKWDNFGRDSWLVALKKLQTSCPQLTELRLEVIWEAISEGPASMNSVELITSAGSPTFSLVFPDLQSLNIKCDPDHSHHEALAYTFARMEAPSLSSLALEGAVSWLWISSIDIRSFLKRTKLETLILKETLYITSTTGNYYPWSNTLNPVATSRHLFQELMLSLRDAGIAVTIHAECDSWVTLDTDMGPHCRSFSDALGAIQDHVQHLQFQYWDEGLHVEPEFEDNYSLPCLRSLNISYKVIRTLSHIARLWDMPNLEVLNLHLAPDPEDDRQVILMVSDLADVIWHQKFPRLKQLRGSVEGMSPKYEGDTYVHKMFRDSLQEACARRQIEMSELTWD